MESYKLESGPFPDVPFNIDALLHEISASRMATSRPNSMSSSSHRSRMSKVTKPGSAGSSPQNMQRRRTSASHRLAKYLSDLYPFSAYGQLGPESGRHSNQSEQAFPSYADRPVSWHPTGIPSFDMDSSFVQNRASMVVPAYQSVQRYGMPTPVVGMGMTPELPLDDWASLDAQDFSSPLVPTFAYPSNLPVQPGPGMSSTRPMPTHSIGLPLQESHQNFSPSSRSSGIWPNYHAAAPSAAGAGPTSAPGLTAPPTPDMLPIQRPIEAQLLEHMKLVPEKDLNLDDGPELVGMGLYDTPIRPDFSRMEIEGGLLGMAMTSEPTGKGLKLEETWEPPEEDDDDGAYSETSEDAPNEADLDFPQQPSSCPAAPSLPQSPASIEMARFIMSEDGYENERLQRMYGDVSKQSFFIECDETNAQAGGDSMVLSHEASQLWLRAMSFGGELVA